MSGPEQDPVGNVAPMDNANRKTLPTTVAAGVGMALTRTGMTFRQAAAKIGTDVGHLHRITRGTRCPSPDVARRLIAVLDLDSATATRLREVAATTVPGQRSRP